MPPLNVMNANGSNPARLSNLGGSMPGFSPDGSQIVFQSERDGNADLYLMPAGGGPASRLSQQGGLLPAWSPDGSQIAFLSNREGALE